jgi:hypothetical protein
VKSCWLLLQMHSVLALKARLQIGPGKPRRRLPDRRRFVGQAGTCAGFYCSARSPPAIHTNTGISTKIFPLSQREIVRVSLQRKSNLPAKKAESGLRERWQQRSQPGGKPAGECRQPRSFCCECEHGWMQGNAGLPAAPDPPRVHPPRRSGPEPGSSKSEKWGASFRKGVRPFAFLCVQRSRMKMKRTKAGNRILPPK